MVLVAARRGHRGHAAHCYIDSDRWLLSSIRVDTVSIDSHRSKETSWCTPSSSSVPARSASPLPPTPGAAACDVVVLEAGRRRRRLRRRVGARPAVLAVVASWSTRSPSRCSSRPGWVAPGPDAYPTGDEWVRALPRSRWPTLLGAATSVEVRFGHRVTGVAREGRDVMVDAGRESEPFAVHVEHAGGRRAAASAGRGRGRLRHLAPARTRWAPTATPPLGSASTPTGSATGSPTSTTRPSGDRYAGQHVVVAGTGASAQNVLVGLARLAVGHPDTRVTWLRAPGRGGTLRRRGQRPARRSAARLGRRAQAVAESSVPSRTLPASARPVVREADGRLTIESVDGQVVTTSTRSWS